jgi:hypothetical protein
VLAFGLMSMTARCDDFFPVRDENPLLRGFFRPLATDAGLHDGAAIDAMLSIANTDSLQQRGSESLAVDGETDALRLSYGNQFAGAWRYRLDLPVIHDSGGFLDTVIADWHRWFNLPQGNRTSSSRNQIAYTYSGSSTLALHHAATSLGDVSADAGWYAVDARAVSVSIWGGVKAPTGSVSRLTSDGAWDGSSWLHAAWHGSRWDAAGEVGIVQPFGDRLFAGAAHTTSGFARLAVTRDFGSAWAVRAQLDGQTRRVEDSELRLLGPSLQLSVGATCKFARRWRVEFGFAEDVAVDTAPDITFFLGVRRQTGAKYPR